MHHFTFIYIKSHLLSLAELPYLWYMKEHDICQSTEIHIKEKNILSKQT